MAQGLAAGDSTLPATLPENDERAMNENERNTLIAAQVEAAQALEAGQRLADRWAKMTRGEPMPEKLPGAALGAWLSSPAEFWSAATTCTANGDGESVLPQALAIKLAAAKLAVGDFDFARQSLVGQSLWLSALAVKLEAEAAQAKNLDGKVPRIKLALAAQRQAAQALATAAALNKLQTAEAVTVGD